MKRKYYGRKKFKRSFKNKKKRSSKRIQKYGSSRGGIRL